MIDAAKGVTQKKSQKESVSTRKKKAAHLKVGIKRVAKGVPSAKSDGKMVRPASRTNGAKKKPTKKIIGNKRARKPVKTVTMESESDGSDSSSPGDSSDSGSEEEAGVAIEDARRKKGKSKPRMQSSSGSAKESAGVLDEEEAEEVQESCRLPKRRRRAPKKRRESSPEIDPASITDPKKRRALKKLENSVGLQEERAGRLIFHT